MDLGITGQDHILESGVDVDLLIQLGFGKCSLSVPQMTDVKAALAGKRIATSSRASPRTTLKARPGEPAGDPGISGSVEAACGLGLADAVNWTSWRREPPWAGGGSGSDNENAGDAHCKQAKQAQGCHRPESIEGYLTATRYMMIGLWGASLAAASPSPRASAAHDEPLEAGDWCRRAS